MNDRLFDGDTIDADTDNDRLNTQLGKVYTALRHSDTDWWTLSMLARRVDASEASVSARLRDLRKPWWGEHTIEKRRAEGRLDGLWLYRMTSEKPLLDGRRSDPHPKLAARERVTVFLDEWERLPLGKARRPIFTAGDYDLTSEDLRTLLR